MAEFNLYDNNNCNIKINEKNQSNNNSNGNQININNNFQRNDSMPFNRFNGSNNFMNGNNLNNNLNIVVSGNKFLEANKDNNNFDQNEDKTVIKEVGYIYRIEKKKCDNIIYLIDTTYSMKKYKNFIELFPIINEDICNHHDNINIGYVFYKDYNSNNKAHSYDHISIFLPSSNGIDIPQELEFSGGFDYAEDWANPIKKISEFILDKTTKNIVIHILTQVLMALLFLIMIIIMQMKIY